MIIFKNYWQQVLIFNKPCVIWNYLQSRLKKNILCSQAALAIIKASEVSPKKDTDEVTAVKSEQKTDPEIVADARQARQYGPYQGQNNNEVVVDIEDEDKTQYYETNYDTSKSKTHKDSCQSRKI